MKKHKEATAQEQSCAVASFLFFRVERTDQNEDSADHIDCRDRSRARRPLGSSGSALVEAVNADLLWCVCDASSDETDEQVAVTRRLMEELGVGDKPMLVLLNKCDLISEAPLLFGERTVLLSAKTGFGFDDLLQKTAAALAPTHRRLRLLIPYDRSGLVNEIMAGGKVFSQEYTPEGTSLDALVDVRILHKVAEFVLHGE